MPHGEGVESSPGLRAREAGGRPDSGLEIISRVAHQLRNPVATIRGLAQLLDSEFERMSEEDRHRFTQAVVRQADRLAKLVDNVVDAARIDAGTLEYASIPVDPVALIRDGAAEAGTAWPDHTVEVEEPSSAPKLLGDHERLKRALAIMLENACMYSSPGTRVTLAASVVDGELRISVADQGIGIEADDLPRVFDRFPRIPAPGIDASRSELSLSIARSIIEAHGGRVWAESPPERGSVFWIALPVAE